MSQQGQFNFEAGGNEEGYAQWLIGRRVAVQELARPIGLPLGHQVEVWLCGGIRLRGRLRLQEDILFIEEEHARHLELVVDHVLSLFARWNRVCELIEENDHAQCWFPWNKY